jgi:hypothetical protein
VFRFSAFLAQACSWLGLQCRGEPGNTLSFLFDPLSLLT